MLQKDVSAAGTTFYNSAFAFALISGVYFAIMICLPSLNRAGLILLVLLAVLLPLLGLSVLQYRSLAELERKTKIAVQDNLRQTLDSIAQRTQDDLTTLATRSLSSISIADIEAERLDDLAQHLSDLRQSNPAIEAAFLVRYCTDQQNKYALFADANGVRRVEPEQFKKDQPAQSAMEAFANAGLLQEQQAKRDGVVFEQASCSIFPHEKGDDHSQVIAFQPLRKSGGHGYNGFAGVLLNGKYVKQQLLPEVINASLSQSTALTVSVIDRDNRELYASGKSAQPLEIKQAFTPVFRQWKLGIGYADTTIDTLARKQFRQNLLFTGIALLLVLCGVTLSLRATTREMKLAEAKSAFVSNVSHELKTPLALIRLFAEMLETGMVKHTNKTQEYGRIINHESRRLTQLINNILDFSRIEAGRREYQFSDANLGVVVEDVLQSYEYQMHSAGFVVTKHIAPTLPLVRVDCDAMAQAVLNLLNNAVKYSLDDKRIEVRVEARAAKLAIAITDHGIGIPRAEQRRIFEKFYRVGSGLIHDTKGSGLGLSIVHHIVAAHSGEVTVESTPGQGSCFTILLPVASAEESAPQQIGGYRIVENPPH